LESLACLELDFSKKEEGKNEKTVQNEQKKTKATQQLSDKALLSSQSEGHDWINCVASTL